MGTGPESWGARGGSRGARAQYVGGPEGLERLEEAFRLRDEGVTEVMAKAGSWEVLQFGSGKFLVAVCRMEPV